MTSEWVHVTLGEVLRQRKSPVQTKAGLSYRLLGVRWYGQGSFVREEVTTSTSKATRLFPVKPGDFIYNRLFAWKGSFAVIPKSQADCYVSGEFPLFEVDESRLRVEYLNLFMCRAVLWKQIEVESTGSTSVSRNRWKEEKFLELSIALPTIAEQSRIIDLMTSVDDYITVTEETLIEARNIRPAILSGLLSGEHGIPESYDRLLGAMCAT